MNHGQCQFRTHCSNWWFVKQYYLSVNAVRVNRLSTSSRDFFFGYEVNTNGTRNTRSVFVILRMRTKSLARCGFLSYNTDSFLYVYMKSILPLLMRYLTSSWLGLRSSWSDSVTGVLCHHQMCKKPLEPFSITWSGP